MTRGAPTDTSPPTQSGERSVLVQLSDPHIRVGTRDRARSDALATAVRGVLELPVTPEAVLLTGDLVDTGADAEYRRVAELLSPLGMPVHVLPGNHDEPDTLREHFALPGSAGDPVQYSVTAGD